MATTRVRSKDLPTSGYTRDSIERALEVHFPGQWLRDPSTGGYSLSTDVGIMRMRTLKDAALLVVAAAEKERAMARKAEAERAATRDREMTAALVLAEEIALQFDLKIVHHTDRVKRYEGFYRNVELFEIVLDRLGVPVRERDRDHAGTPYLVATFI